MGWTGTLNTFKTTKEFLVNEFSGEDENFVWSLLDVSMRGSVAYGIAMRADKKTGILLSEGMVILTRKEDGWIYYKEMGETVMPYYYDAPLKLIKKLNALGEPFNDNARQWRAKCMEVASKPKVKVKYGDLLKFSSALKFPNIGLTEDTFMYTDYKGKRNIFRSNTDGSLVCIPKWQKREFTVLSN